MTTRRLRLDLFFLFSFLFLQHFPFHLSPKYHKRNETEKIAQNDFAFSIIHRFQFVFSEYNTINTFSSFQHYRQEKKRKKGFRRHFHPPVGRMKRSECISEIDSDKWTVLWDYHVSQLCSPFEEATVEKINFPHLVQF